ncbi:ABC transporter permease [Microbacterium sp. JZ31]|uniref:ABC transporter permease n=1 Tax=Microbacterium sp. JZ31 TaxID=1906274 RepID=UPI001EE3E434|nr:ABC transporter permease [Microbacterium sp. JZ31]
MTRQLVDQRDRTEAATTPRSALTTTVPDTSGTAPWSSRLAFLRERGMGASILVAALSSAFGVLLLSATGFIGALIAADPYLGDSALALAVISILGGVLLLLALYVAAIVTANTFSTIVAGRTRQIALMRLIGATSRSQRSEVATQGLVVGAIGAAIGLAVGIGIAAAGIALGRRFVGDVPYDVAQASLLIPAAIVVLTTWAAAWAGSRRVLTVTPLQAIGRSVERQHDEFARPARSVTSLILIGLGAALLGLGVMIGMANPLGVLPAFLGGLLSFTGLVIGSTAIMPPLLRITGRIFGGSAVARLASENALRYPERSSRTGIGVVVGVTLVTMFAVAAETAQQLMITSAQQSGYPQERMAVLDNFALVMMVLVGVSAVIAAVGLVNLLTIGVVQRRRELGLLRALGLSNAQIRRMVLLEATHITLTSVVFGLVLGIAYGWAGAQSVLGAVPLQMGLSAFIVTPAIPWLTIGGVVAAAAVLTLVAAVTPTRLATRVAPVEALAD